MARRGPSNRSCARLRFASRRLAAASGCPEEVACACSAPARRAATRFNQRSIGYAAPPRHGQWTPHPARAPSATATPPPTHHASDRRRGRRAAGSPPAHSIVTPTKASLALARRSRRWLVEARSLCRSRRSSQSLASSCGCCCTSSAAMPSMRIARLSSNESEIRTLLMLRLKMLASEAVA